MTRLQKRISTYEALQEEDAGLRELTGTLVTSINPSVEKTQVSPELALQTTDIPMQEELVSELDDLKARSETYLVTLWLSEPVDENSAYIEVHAGSGGTEACDWTSMLSRMYTKWANSQNYQGTRIQPLSLSV